MDHSHQIPLSTYQGGSRWYSENAGKSSQWGRQEEISLLPPPRQNWQQTSVTEEERNWAPCFILTTDGPHTPFGQPLRWWGNIQERCFSMGVFVSLCCFKVVEKQGEKSQPVGHGGRPAILALQVLRQDKNSRPAWATEWEPTKDKSWCQQDGSAGEAPAAKPVGLSSTLGIHMGRKERIPAILPPTLSVVLKTTQYVWIFRHIPTSLPSLPMPNPITSLATYHPDHPTSPTRSMESERGNQRGRLSPNPH